jgi:hypothetical protein
MGDQSPKLHTIGKSREVQSDVCGASTHGTEQHPADTTHFTTLEISRDSVAAKQLARLVASLLAGERTVEFHSASAGESDALEKAFVGFTTVHWQIPEVLPQSLGKGQSYQHP